MPFTLFAHQSVVLPLKWARPRWFDGAALCFGSMAPDWAYAFEGTRWTVRSHTLAAQVWWTLPIAVAATLLFRHVIAAPLSRELPAWVGAQVACLARARRSLFVTCTSALVGGLSHVFLDGFTHSRGWATRRWALLTTPVSLGSTTLPLSRLLQYGGHVVGSLVGAWLLWRAIRLGKLAAWSGVTPPAPLPGAPAVDPRFWVPVLAGVCLSVLAAGSALVTGGGIPAAFTRLSVTIGLGVVLGAMVARRAD